MTASFEYKLIAQHVNNAERVRHVTWRLIANYDNKSSFSEFTHPGPGTLAGELDDVQIMEWIINQIHPSDLIAMRAGLAANVQNMD